MKKTVPERYDFCSKYQPYYAFVWDAMTSSINPL